MRARFQRPWRKPMRLRPRCAARGSSAARLAVSRLVVAGAVPGIAVPGLVVAPAVPGIGVAGLLVAGAAARSVGAGRVTLTLARGLCDAPARLPWHRRRLHSWQRWRRD